MNEDLCKCGEESTRGCHGINDEGVYSEYYCDKCYHSKLQKKDVKNDSAEVV